MKRVVIALDVGGTSIKHGIVNQQQQVIGGALRTEIDTTANRETLLGHFEAVIRQRIDDVATIEGADCLGVGLGMPSPFDYDAGVPYIDDLGKYESLYGVNMRDALQTRLHTALPLRFRNDAEAAIVGEWRYGVGRAYSRVIGVTLGSGFGSAFLVDGVPQKEGAGVPADGWLFPEPWRDSTSEEHFSLKGINARLRDLGFSGTAKDAADAARAGDDALIAMFREWGRDMGMFLQPYIKAFGADALIVLGGLSGAWSLFGEALAEMTTIPTHAGTLPDKAALLGAADLFFYEES